MPSARVAAILASIIDNGDRSSSLAERLCLECRARLRISGVGIALMSADGSSSLVAATDGPARHLEDLQFSLGEGPCVEASRTGRPVMQPDVLVTAPDRWPAFGAGVQSTGIRAIFAFPLQVGAIRLGILDLYRDVAGSLTDADFSDALAFADAATWVLLSLQDQANIEGHPLMPIDVLDNRAETHQATGMISVQLGVDLKESLLRLRAAAYAADRPMSDLAVDVVGGRVRFDNGEGGFTSYRSAGA